MDDQEKTTRSSCISENEVETKDKYCSDDFAAIGLECNSRSRQLRKRKKKVLDKLECDSVPSLRKGRQDLPLREKIKILEMLENDPKTPQRTIASTFKVSQSQISRIQNNKAKLTAAWQKGNMERKRDRRGKGGLIEQKLLEWYNEAVKEGLPVSGPTLMEKAKGIGGDLNVDFTPTSGWFGRWKNRNGITLKLAKNDDTSLAFNKISSHWRRYSFTKVLREYDLSNIWFLGELPLLSKATPENLEHPKVNVLDKGRMNLYLAFNYLGNERRSPLILGSERALDDLSHLNYFYTADDKVRLFTKFLLRWDKELRSARRKICLFLCRDLHLQENLNITSISLHYFPEGEMSYLKIQPFNLGISSTFKSLYRYQVSLHDLSNSALKARSSDNLSNCRSKSYDERLSSAVDQLVTRIFMLRRAWKHVHPDILVKAIVRAGLSRHIRSLNVEGDINPPPGMTIEQFQKYVEIEKLYSDKNVCVENEGSVGQLNEDDEAVPTVSESEALNACAVLRTFLQKKSNMNDVESLASIESNIARQIMGSGGENESEESFVDPLFDPRSLHSLERHSSSVVKQESLRGELQTPLKSISQPSEIDNMLPADAATNCAQSRNLGLHMRVVPPVQPVEHEIVLNDHLKQSQCNPLPTFSHDLPLPPPVCQYQTTTSYIPQNVELKNGVYGAPRAISDVTIDRYALHHEVQQARPISDINPQLIPAQQLTSQTPTFITFASHF